MLAIIGYILAIFVGLSIGIIGAGGSILALPILVYLFGIEAAETAPAYSLFIVAVSSLFGSYMKNKQGLINFKLVWSFGIPTVIAIFITRYFVVPTIPNEVFIIGQFVVTKRLLVMSLFSVLMIIASFYMMQQNKSEKPVKVNALLNYSGGFATGFLTGFVGAGGGFMLVPALIKIGNLGVKAAVATSMVIIAINTSVGFAASIAHVTIDWMLLLTFSGLAVSGIFIGNSLSKKVNATQLKKGFGWFILLTGLFILINELFLKQ
ncbi:MAG TPA: sulfite exporter TauE/SafE family protein [Vicingus sp.]|nr:sulfite exporter TauE/SafE family protein [Vicingus sp.]HRP59726.1 sulfite exporter TauE/SafE family protein [Vicingus sp.]